MAGPSPIPFSRPEYDQRLLQTSLEVIEQSYALLDETKPLVKRPSEGSAAAPQTNPADPDSKP